MTLVAELFLSGYSCRAEAESLNKDKENKKKKKAKKEKATVRALDDDPARMTEMIMLMQNRFFRW